jgi:hypothetical protein
MPTTDNPVKFDTLANITYAIQELVKEKGIISHEDLIIVLRGLIWTSVDLGIFDTQEDNKGRLHYIYKGARS